MKKIFTLMVGLFMAFGATATNYNGMLGVTIDATQLFQNDVNVTLEQNEDGSYNFVLKNFVLANSETTIPVGNINVSNLTATQDEAGNKVMSASKVITIPAGDDPAVQAWYGPMIGEVPLVLDVTFNDVQMKVHIDIDMTTSPLEQMIKVDFLGNTKIAPVKGGSDKPCDVNGDGIVDVADVTLVIDAVLGK